MLQEKVCANDAQKLLMSYKKINTAFALAWGFHKDPSSLYYLSQESPAAFFSQVCYDNIFSEQVILTVQLISLKCSAVKKKNQNGVWGEIIDEFGICFP